MIKAIILDLDDTLCMTEAACFDMENDVLQRMGRSAMSREVHTATWGRPLFDVILDRSPGINVDAFRRAYEPVIQEYVESGRLDSIPEVNLQALDRLTAIGKQLLILTSRTHTELQHMLEPGHHLSSRVANFYYKDNMQHHKPDPRAFDELLQDNQLKPEEALYVGDSITDVQAAKGAGLHFVASLESGLRTKADFAEQPVDAFIESFPEIVATVQALDAAATGVQK